MRPPWLKTYMEIGRIGTQICHLGNISKIPNLLFRRFLSSIIIANVSLFCLSFIHPSMQRMPQVNRPIIRQKTQLGAPTLVWQWPKRAAPLCQHLASIPSGPTTSSIPSTTSRRSQSSGDQRYKTEPATCQCHSQTAVFCVFYWRSNKWRCSSSRVEETKLTHMGHYKSSKQFS